MPELTSTLTAARGEWLCEALDRKAVAAPGMTAHKWKPCQRGSMLGFFSLKLASGITIHDCRLMETNGRRWISFPSRQYEADGVKKWMPYVEIEDRQTRDKFQAAALAALAAAPKESHPAPKQEIADDVPF